ncbi:MAG TPA: bifunctional phosphopantothenoylcysteine decarboxylase/phosphopantothenate--cysteine ligase CoaBC [Desulfobulbus sp.]|nr:bifunctional phosphopantothenoylcysteine decarboxylase/phosphopantothenate--cysteine ligase CoaBC [Desulfobulbus sp.]
MAAHPGPGPGLQGRRILFGVTGSIAAFKAAGWVRCLAREEARVTVVMTRAAEQFISRLTFGALSGNRVHGDMFADDPAGIMAHITLSREADCVLIAPATAQTIARLAHGMADDLLSATVLAADIPVVLCPAMNTNMLRHPATRDNLERLRGIGYTVIEPASGTLACGEVGAGRMPGWDLVRETLLALFADQDLEGRRILITAGPTREPLDPVRYLSNRSSGRMGYALARTARRRGGEVRLVTGPVSLSDPPGVEVIRVTTAQEMRDAVLALAGSVDIIVGAAAVADFRPRSCRELKIKKSGADPCIELEPNPDIMAELGRSRRSGQLLVGFAAESHDHEQEGRRKLEEKNLDLVVVNDILGSRTGFDVETNQVTLLTARDRRQLPLLSKEATADRIWDRVVELGRGSG